jgi:exonuclease III
LPLTTKIRGSNNHFSLISLNINGLNSTIKRHKLTHWTKKLDPAFCCIQETHLSDKDSHYFRVKDWKAIFQETSWSSEETSYWSKEKSTRMNFQFLNKYAPSPRARTFIKET